MQERLRALPKGLSAGIKRAKGGPSIRRRVLLTAVLAVLLLAGLGRASAPPRLSFSAAVGLGAPDGFGDAEAIAAGDLDGDGRPDLAFGSAQDRAVWIALTTAGGRLDVQPHEYPVGAGPTSLAIGDL